MNTQPSFNFVEQWRQDNIKPTTIKVVYLEELLLISLLSSCLPKKRVDGENMYLSSSDVELVLDTSTSKELFYLAAVSTVLAEKHSSHDVCFDRNEFKSLEQLKKEPRFKYADASKYFNSFYDLITIAFRKCRFMFKPKMRTLHTNRDQFSFYKRVFSGIYKSLLLGYGNEFEEVHVKSLLTVLIQQNEAKNLYQLMPER